MRIARVDWFCELAVGVLATISASGCAILPITADDVAVRTTFKVYDKVGIWARLPREEEEIFLTRYMAAFPGQAVVERRDLAAIIGEQDILPERLDEETRAKIRRILGVKAIVFPNSSKNQFAVKVLDTETGEIVASVVCAKITMVSTGLPKGFLIWQAIQLLKRKARAP